MKNEQNYGLAFVFPGQGSQSVGMLAELAETYPQVKQTFEEASDALGFDLWNLVQNGPVEELNQTYNTQPAMLAAGVAVWRVWNEQTLMRPAWMAGHSLGEYTALVCAEALAFQDAVTLVADRGRFMQEAVPEGVGAMAAIIGLEDHVVVNLCAENCDDEIVSAVNFNAPGQVVIAGHAPAVERAMAAAKEAGAKRALKLPVSVPSHCQLMEPAAEKLAARLAEIEIQSPQVSLLHNVDVAVHTAPDVIRNVLREQLFKPVRWVDTIRFMHDQGVQAIVECGPGKVLMGLNRRIVKEMKHYSIYDPATLDKVLEQIDG
jgi:[acyl-carrier-protein] S-malonyltransferase